MVSHSATLSTFIKLTFVFKTVVLSIFWSFKRGVYIIRLTSAGDQIFPVETKVFPENVSLGYMGQKNLSRSGNKDSFGMVTLVTVSYLSSHDRYAKREVSIIRKYNNHTLHKPRHREKELQNTEWQNTSGRQLK